MKPNSSLTARKPLRLRIITAIGGPACRSSRRVASSRNRFRLYRPVTGSTYASRWASWRLFWRTRMIKASASANSAESTSSSSTVVRVNWRVWPSTIERGTTLNRYQFCTPMGV